MVDLRFDPGRRCMPLEEWPESDRRAWQCAVAVGGLFNDSGLAAHWRPRTKRLTVQNYGRWLTFLHRQDLLDGASMPAARVTSDRIAAYVEQLRQGCNDSTVVIRVDGLVRALRVMAPDHDWGWLRRVAGRLRRSIKTRREKQGRIRPSYELFALGLHLVDEAERTLERYPCHGPPRYRDGLIIATLAARPLRLSTLAALRVDEHLVRRSDGFWLYVPPELTKTGEPYECPLPPELTRRVDRYLGIYRPMLLKIADHPYLWATKDGAPMRDGAIYTGIKKLTQKHLGVVVNPHLFRDCAATSIALEDPAHVRMAAPLLGHRSLSTTERHYNQARMIEASRRHVGVIQTLRRGNQDQADPQ